VSKENFKQGRLYPLVQEIREVSVKIALRIAEECYKVRISEVNLQIF
jgi:alpha-D-ribose 1-methylphosphonate 5-triphosphate synthase subunit PhnI